MSIAPLVAALLGLAVCAMPALAVGPGPVHKCGNFVSYSPPSATRSGTLVIGSTTYAASWMGSTGPAGSSPHPFKQVISNGVTAGSSVCLDGTIVNSETEGNLLTDFTVSPAPTASQLPTTSTGRGDPIGLLRLVAAGVIAAAATLRLRTPRAAP